MNVELHPAFDLKNLKISRRLSLLDRLDPTETEARAVVTKAYKIL